MSVYRRPGAATFSFDFQYGGHRFSGDTGKTAKREARTAEGIEREKAKVEVAKRKRLNAPQLWEEASSRWFTEIGAHHVQIEQTLASLIWLEREIGKATALTAIDDNMVARLVAKRRREKRRGKGWKRDEPVSNATVNRTVTEPLRKVLRRAEKVWKVPVGDVDWAQHRLEEPKERIREAADQEEAAIMGELERGYDEATEFGFINGCRRMEVIGLKKTMVDFFNRQFTVLGKGGKVRVIPMNERTYEMLWRKRHEPTDFVFTYVAARTDKRKGTIKGQRYPLTENGFRSAQRRAIKRGGVVNFRPHDARHTAATRVLRQSNLRVVQELLGHSDVTTTAKYAHALKEDVRAALEAASPTKNPTAPEADSAKLLGDRNNER